MIKTALVIVITSVSNPQKAPDISVPIFYDSAEACQDQMDKLKENINAIEFFDNNNKRMLKFYNREYHHQSIIYWSCEKEINKSR